MRKALKHAPRCTKLAVTAHESGARRMGTGKALNTQLGIVRLTRCGAMVPNVRHKLHNMRK